MSRRSTSSLASLQTWFFGQLQPSAVRMAGPVLGTRWLSARRRIDIYADMYQARLVEALSLDFPRLSEALTPARFERIAVAYLERFPSRRATIQDVGARLPGFLKSAWAAGKLRRFPFAADLARLERIGSEVYVAPEDTGVDAEAEGAPLTADRLRKVRPQDWPKLRFKVTATLRTVRVGFRFPLRAQKGAKPVRERTIYRIYRRGLDVFEAPMDAAEARALALVQQGHTFGEVCLALGDATTAAKALATWVDEGLLLGLTAT